MHTFWQDVRYGIVGVTSDAKNQGIEEPVSPEVFVPYTLTGGFERGVLVRTHGDPEALIGSYCTIVKTSR